MLKLDSHSTEDPYAAGIAFDFLLVNHKNIHLEPSQRETLVRNQEAILAESVKQAENLPPGQPIFPIGAQHAGIRLARYYRSLKRQDEVRRVLALYARAYIAAGKRLPAMIGAAWLREAYLLLTDFGCTQEADKVGVILREVAANSMSHMVSFEDKIEITKQELDDWVNSILAGPLEEVLVRIVWRFIPDPTQIETQVKEIAKKAPLSSSFGITQVDSSGRPVAEIGSIKEDLKGRVLYQIVQNLQFEAQFLRYLFVQLLSRYNLNAEAITSEIFMSPIFQPDRRPTVRKGVDACLGDDHIVSAHLLIPQIEHALRTLAIMAGASPYKPDHRRGGLQYKVMDDLLRERAIVQILGEQVILCFRIVLTDPGGWNLRNSLSHGILNPSQLGPASSDRLLHILLTLSRVRPRGQSGLPRSSPSLAVGGKIKDDAIR